MVFVWISAPFGFYLIGFQLKYIAGDFFVNNVTFAVTEIMANIASGIILETMGINRTFLFSYSLALTGMLCLTFIDT